MYVCMYVFSCIQHAILFGNSAWDFWGAKLWWSRNFWGFCWKPGGFFGFFYFCPDGLSQRFIYINTFLIFFSTSLTILFSLDTNWT